MTTRIHITYTGGTIGMVESPHGLTPGADMRGWLRGMLDGARIDPSLVSFTQLEPLIDSSCATPDSWQAIIDDLRAHREDADAFVVLHGTDTMSYTSAALSYALTGFGRPVILTGSQYPLGVVQSDAAANVAGALNAAMSGRAQGVGLFFGNRLLAGNRVSKVSSWSFEGFDAPSAGLLVRTGAPWRWEPYTDTGEGWMDPLPYRRHDVAVLDLVPGVSAARLEAMLRPNPEAVLIRAYGVGNIPYDEPGLTDVIAALPAQGVPVVFSSQCQQANVILGRYLAGDAIARAGALGTADMTLEAAYAKIVFLLSQGLTGPAFADWFAHRSIAGEITL